MRQKGFLALPARTLRFFSLTAFIAGLCVFLAALFSCSNLGDDYSGPGLFPDVQLGGTVFPAKIGQGRVTGAIDQNGGVSKSVLPDPAVVLSDVHSYIVKAWGEKADGTVVPEASAILATVDFTAKTFAINLDYGSWTIRADGLDASGNIILTQTTADPIVLNEENPVVNLNFALDYPKITGQKGALDLTITFDTSLSIISQVTYSLKKGETQIAAGSAFTSSLGGTFRIDSSLNSTFGDLEPGDYKLEVDFRSSGNFIVIRLDQDVQIYSNITTTKIDDKYAPYINDSSGSIEISEEVVKKYQQSVVYVGGTGLNTGIAASDSNNGTQFDPVEHLERAIQIINGSSLTASDVPDGFKIYVQDNLALAQNVAFSGSKKIKVIGTNQSALYKVDGAVTYGLTASASDLSFSYINFDRIKGFVVAGGQTTLNNCKITNGEAVSGNGGGIYIKGTGAIAKLANCSISGCHAGYGGAIYVSDDSGIGTAELELKDCLIGAESDSPAQSADTKHSNSADGGGGIYIGGNGKVTFVGTNKVSYNYATGAGGGINVNSDSEIDFTGVEVLNNASGSNGGGIYVGKKVVLDGVTISGNAADDNGGGVWASVSTSQIKFTSGTIIGNKATGDGGGVYVGNSAKMIMGGSAVIGDKNADGPATELLSSNKAGSGGGIAVADSANVFIGYTDANASSTDDSFDGGIFYNYASGSGGGVYLNGSSAKVYFYKGSVEKNLGLYWGGALAVGNEGAAEINGTSILDNNTAYYGGGISIGETAAGAGTVLVQNSLIARNCALLDGYWEGGAIRAYAYTSLTLKGSVSIPAGDSSGATGPGKNDVYLASGKTITIGSILNADTTPVATITPETYASGTAVLSDNTGIGTLVKSELSKIAVTPQSADEEWTIGQDSSTKKGVLATANIYVSGGSDGNDTTGTGSSAAPYKTVAFALTKVMAPNCSIIIKESTTESAALNVTAAMIGLTIRSVDTAPKTITGLVTKKIDLKTAATISKIAFDTWGSVEVSDNVATVELNDVSIKNSYNAVAGGGLRIGNNAKVKASNLELDNCHASLGGGGIFVSPGSELNADGLTVTDCYAEGTGIGGGICNGGTLFAKDARISGCSAAGGGAGILNDNGASLVLDGDCDISSQIYLMGKSSTMTTASNPIYVKAYFGLADGATKIPVAVEENSGVGEQFKDGDALVQGYGEGAGAYSITEEQVNCFATSGTALSLQYDETVTPHCGKLVDKSIHGGITVSLGGNISFTIAVPSLTSARAAFEVKDNSSSPATIVTPDSARVEIRQYGSAIYAAADQEVAAPYLAAGSYELYCKAVIGGVVYDTTVPFGYGALYTPLTLEAEAASTKVTFLNEAANPVTYKINGGTGGTIASGGGSETITLSHAGDYVSFYGDNEAYDTDGTSYSHISCDKDCYVYGNIMSLIKSSGFENETTLTGTYTFSHLFYYNSNIKNKAGADLVLPATTLTKQCYYEMFDRCTKLAAAPKLPATSLGEGCYWRMFSDCTSLTAAPELPATTAVKDCYCAMFRNCSNLTKAPALPATTLADSCYQNMFFGCTRLTSAPALPATTLAASCYIYMFSGCTSLTSAPALPATTLTSSCYESMFNGCSSLNSVTCLATNISASDCTTDWLDGVATSGTFTKAAAMTGWTPDSPSGIPVGWTVGDYPGP